MFISPCFLFISFRSLTALQVGFLFSNFSSVKSNWEACSVNWLSDLPHFWKMLLNSCELTLRAKEDWRAKRLGLSNIFLWSLETRQFFKSSRNPHQAKMTFRGWGRNRESNKLGQMWCHRPFLKAGYWEGQGGDCRFSVRPRCVFLSGEVSSGLPGKLH